MSHMSRVPFIDIKSDEPIYVAFLGDMHYGAETCNYRALKKFRDWAKFNPNCYWVGMGDYIENAAPLTSPRGAIWEQNVDPGQQYFWFEDFWYGSSCLGLLEGNHEWRTPKVTAIPLVELLARHLGCLNLEEGGYFVIRINKKIKYTFYAAHGYGSSATKGYHLRKLIQQVGVDDADIVAIGHIHQLHHESFIRKRVVRGRNVWQEIHGLRTGGFLDTPKYAKRRMYTWARIGAPIVKLQHDEKKIGIDITTRVPD